MWERNFNQLPLARALAMDQTQSPGMCPDWESDQLPLASQNDPQTTEHTGQG